MGKSKDEEKDELIETFYFIITGINRNRRKEYRFEIPEDELEDAVDDYLEAYDV